MKDQPTMKWIHAHLRTLQEWPWPWSARDHSTRIWEAKWKGKVVVRNQSTVEDDDGDDDYDDD